MPYLLLMSADPIVVAILIALGSLCGLLLSIVPRLVKKFGPHIGRSATPTLNATLLGAYVALGWWVHYQLGVSYPRERAAYMQKVAADELACEYCMAPTDGRHAWILFWLVAGLVAYAVGSFGRHRVAAHRAAGASLSLPAVVVAWSFIQAAGDPLEIIVTLMFAAVFIGAGVTVAGAPPPADIQPEVRPRRFRQPHA